jgi:flagellar FliL protein
MAPEEKKDAAEGEVKKKSKLPLIIIVVVVLLLGGGAAAFFLMGSSAPVDGVPKEPVERIEQVKLEPFIVNLSDNSNFLRTVLVLEYDYNIVVGEKASNTEDGVAEGSAGAGGEMIPTELVGALATREPHIRDAVIGVLSAKKASEVLSVEGKEILKEELLDAINDATGLDEPGVLAVYFLDFIVQ